MSLSRLAGLFFEPVFIIMLLGAVSLLWPLKQKTQMSFGRITVVCFFIMLLWRCFCAQDSSRYWAITLIPGLLFCVYFLYMPFWGIRVSRILSCIIIVICVGKDFCLNWNNTVIIDAVAIMEDDSKNWHRQLCIEYGNSLIGRVEYYSQLPCLEDGAESLELLNNILAAAQGLYDVVYVYASLTSDDFVKLKNVLNEQRGTLLFSQYADRHKKKRICLFAIPIPSQEELSPDKIEREWIRNGGFESLTPRKDPLPYFPEAWEKSGDKFGFAEEPITEKNSLTLKSKSTMLLYSGLMEIPLDDKKILFKVKKAVGATISIYGDYGTSTPRYTILHRQDIASMRVSTNELHTFQVPWAPINEPGATWVRLGFRITAPDGLIIDDVELYPMEEEKKLK